MLPVLQIKSQLMAAVEKNGIVVLSAPTGSGKSTQVPQMLLESVEGRIVVLQPRRLATRMLAERVAFELGVKLGTLVGFQTRYERVLSPETRILFITEAILTRMLISDPTLKGIDAVVFDEFHERSLNTDLDLAMTHHCRQTHRPDLKMVVMSATLDAQPLLDFLPGSIHVHAEGRLYPVEISYLPPPVHPNAYMNAARALRSIIDRHLEGDILIFMPGGYEIRKTEEECRRQPLAETVAIMPLYGDLPPEQQRAVMEPCKTRKVIIATNIAETSLTIPGVRHVIDSGLARISRYDAMRGIDMLETQKIARDSADQRAGRAGRQAPGTCQRLWSDIEQSQKPPKSIPEIARVDLAEAVLAVNSFGFHDPMAFPWYEQPPQKPLLESARLLEQLGILMPNQGGLSELGRSLLAIPAHPRLAMLLHYGAQHRCFTYTAMAAALIAGRPLITAQTRDAATLKQHRQDAKHLKKDTHVPQSDFFDRMALLQDAADADFDLQRCQAMGIHAGAARDAWREYQDFIKIARRMNWNLETDDNAPEAFLRGILHAFPDRLAKRRNLGTLLCDLADERHGELAKDSVVRDEPLFIAAEMRENAELRQNNGTGIQTAKTILSLNSGIREQWLWDDFPDALVDGDETYWDETSQQVKRRLSLTCFGVTLDETLRQDPDPVQAAELLAQRLDEGKLTLPNWNDDVEKWISRVRWLRNAMPEHPLPQYDAEDIAKIHRILCSGVTSYRALKEKSCLDAARALLKGADIQFVETNAPAMLYLPKGRRMRIEYVPGQAPKGRARIQDIYDMTKTIRIAGGRVSILMDILAPNNRTVQITEDMESFWSVTYPKIKPMLSRRYPKHEWR